MLLEGDPPGPGVMSWADFLAKGDPVHDAEVARRRAALDGDSATTLIYTSGTTGTPKARDAHAAQPRVHRRADPGAGADRRRRPPDQLPAALAHRRAGRLAPALDRDGRRRLLHREPREAARGAASRCGRTSSSACRASGRRCRRRSRRRARRRARCGGGSSPGPRSVGPADGRRRPGAAPRGPGATALADRLVFSKVRERLGLDRARLCAVSSAPIAKETLEFFQSLGLPIMEAYGMSECTRARHDVAARDATALGAAGYAIPGTELAIAEDGEVVIRGPHVFKGYYKNDAATRETLDAEGWLHSGDVGEIDGDGFLRITDRKKELIITAGGKNIAPQHLEGQLKQIAAVSPGGRDRRPAPVPGRAPHARPGAGGRGSREGRKRRAHGRGGARMRALPGAPRAPDRGGQRTPRALRDDQEVRARCRGSSRSRPAS